MGDMGPGEDRQRIDRWIEESQNLLGRLLPTLLDDRERLRSKVEAAEQECERLRGELGERQREIAELRSEIENFRSERAAVAEAFSSLVDHLGQMQKPLHEMVRRLEVAPPVAMDAR